MDLSSLKALGEIGGLGGIAMGAVVLIVRPIIERTSALPLGKRAPTLRATDPGGEMTTNRPAAAGARP